MVLRKQRSYGATHLNAKVKAAPAAPAKKVVPPSPKGGKKKGKK